MENFTIDLVYEGALFKGLISPREENGKRIYTIQFESGDQENFMDIIAIPPRSGSEGEWVFECLDDQEPTEHYDKELLSEIGEAIERYETHNNIQ